MTSKPTQQSDKVYSVAIPWVKTLELTPHLQEGKINREPGGDHLGQGVERSDDQRLEVYAGGSLGENYFTDWSNMPLDRGAVTSLFIEHVNYERTFTK